MKKIIWLMLFIFPLLCLSQENKNVYFMGVPDETIYVSKKNEYFKLVTIVKDTFQVFIREHSEDSHNVYEQKFINKDTIIVDVKKLKVKYNHTLTILNSKDKRVCRKYIEFLD